MKILLTSVAAGLSLLAFACTIQSTGGAQGTDAGPTTTTPDAGAEASSEAGSDAASALPGALTCLEILDCAGVCTGTGCEDACLARGTPAAKTVTTNLATCFTNNACADAECVKAKCPTELDACVAQNNVEPRPVDTIPTGSVPANLTGKWSHFFPGTANLDQFTFNADGTAAHHVELAYKGIGSCTNTVAEDTTGTVVFTADTMTYYQETGTRFSNSCGNERTETPAKEAYEYAWSLDADGKLLLVDRNSQVCRETPTESYCRKLFAK